MIRTLAIVLGCFFCSGPALAGSGGLDEFLRNLSIEARADPEGFSATLRSQFHVSGAQVEVVLGSVRDPADAFMILQLGQMSRQPTETVMSVYQTHAKKGWGAMAQELGIKPGSAEFHALKSGDLHFGFGAPAASQGDDAGATTGRAKGKKGGR